MGFWGLAPLATLIVFFYLTPHRQMSYFWGTGREPPTKRIIYVSTWRNDDGLMVENVDSVQIEAKIPGQRP